MNGKAQKHGSDYSKDYLTDVLVRTDGPSQDSLRTPK